MDNEATALKETGTATSVRRRWVLFRCCVCEPVRVPSAAAHAAAEHDFPV